MSSSTDQPDNPYVGPRAFDIEDREKFFGRERETRDLRHLLVAERIVLLYAPSGAGKTSLIKAALNPRLRDEKFRVLPVIRVNTPPPDGLDGGANRYVLSALQSLEKGLLEEGVLAEQRTPDELAGMSIMEYLERLPQPEDGPKREVLIFDQFEEILTVDPNRFEARDERRAFFRQVGEALADRRRWALFALREDYLAGLDPYLGPIPTRLDTRFRLDLLEQEAATRAIREPARGLGVEFSDMAAADLVGDLLEVRVARNGKVEEEKGLYVEPVHLQVVCYRLWDKLRPTDGAEITEEHVDQAADVDTTLADYYDEQVRRVAAAEDDASERRIREWFDRQLITPQGIRGQVPKGPDASGGLDNRVVDALAAAQLVRREMRLNAIWYELSHDRLIDPVRQSNAAWFAQNLQAWQRDAERWASQEEPPDLLARGAVLSQAERWARDHPQDLTATEWQFLKASRDARFRVRRNRAAAILGVATLLLVAFIFVRNNFEHDREMLIAELKAQRNAIEASYQKSEADRYKAEALGHALEADSRAQVALAGDLAAQAQEVTDPILGLLLAIESHELSPTSEGEQALRNGLALLPRSKAPLVHEDAVNAVAFSHDGRWVATGSNDGTVVVWETETGREVTRMPHAPGEAVFDVAFSHDDTRLATGAGPKEGGGPGDAVVWNAVTGREIARLPHGDSVVAVEFSHDSGRLATASWDSTARIWDTADWSQLYELPHNGRLTSVAFSPDSLLLATGSGDAIARVWNTDTGQEVTRFEHNYGVSTLAFSPDTDNLFLATADRHVRVWDLATKREVSRIAHGNWLRSVAFSPDGKRLASAGADGTARVWEWPSGYESARVAHDDVVTSTAFSPDGNWLATASYDGTARVWQSTAKEEWLHEGWAWSVALSPDGGLLAAGSDATSVPVRDIESGQVVAEVAHEGSTRLVEFSPKGHLSATGAEDGTARVWDTLTGKDLARVEVPDKSAVVALQFSANGTRLAIGSMSGSVQVWDATADGVVAQMKHDGAVRQVAFSPDGKWLVSASEDMTTRVWEVATGKEFARQKHDPNPANAVAFSPDGRFVASGEGCPTYVVCTAHATIWKFEAGKIVPEVAPIEHDDYVASLSFSPDGRWLATASGNDFVVLWDTTTWQVHARMRHAGGLHDAEFSADSNWLATAGQDSTARVWEVDSGAQVAQVDHRALVMDADFSPDGKWLATASGDGTTRLWLVSSEDLKAEACDRLPRNLSRDEWNRFLGKVGKPGVMGTDVSFELTCPNLPAEGAPTAATPVALVPELAGDIGASRGLLAATPVSSPGAVPARAPLSTPTPWPTQSATDVERNTHTSRTTGFSLT